MTVNHHQKYFTFSVNSTDQFLLRSPRISDNQELKSQDCFT